MKYLKEGKEFEAVQFNLNIESAKECYTFCLHTDNIDNDDEVVECLERMVGRNQLYFLIPSKPGYYAVVAGKGDFIVKDEEETFFVENEVNFKANYREV